jgi:hypothetical protein
MPSSMTLLWMSMESWSTYFRLMLQVERIIDILVI